MNSRRPEGEKDGLPDWRIRLSIQYPGLDNGQLFFRVSIEPKDLPSAGLHDYSKVRQKNITRAVINEDSNSGVVRVAEDLRRHYSFMKERYGIKPFWTVENRFTNTIYYFRGDAMISKDEFYAHTLSFYSQLLAIQFVDEVTDKFMILSKQCEDTSTRSDSVLLLLRFWNLVCQRAHPFCNAARKEKNGPPLLPKRILDLRPLLCVNPMFTEIVPVPPVLKSPPPGARAPYATLSHCWGKAPTLKTLNDNIARWEEEIPWSELPQTFKDAINITRKLGLRYLWIDSLCIIQDSLEDWKEQSAKMGDIYRNGELCISALDANDSSEGIFRSRNGWLHRPCRLWDVPPAGLCLPRCNSPIYLFPTIQQPEPRPLLQRGWVLQEDLLSPRRIGFGRNMVYWNCLTMEVNSHSPHLIEGKVDALETQGEFNWQQFFYAGIGGLLNLHVDMTKLYQSWLFIVENYSRRTLTKGSDRLTALAGIATEFQHVTGDSYLCGSWNRNLWRQLLWCVSVKGSPHFINRAPKEYREPRRVESFSAPSWSWSGIDAPINYFHVYPIDSFLDHKVLVEVLQADCSPDSPTSISHDYTGFLVLKGLISNVIAKPFNLDSRRIMSAVPSAEVQFDQLIESLVQKGAGVGLGQTPSSSSRLDPTGGIDDFETGRNSTGSISSRNLSWTKYRQQLNKGCYAPDHEFNVKYRQQTNFEVFTDIKDRYPGHPVFHPEGGEQVGYWAPDFPDGQDSFPVTCLAVSSYRKLVFCLGLKSVSGYENRYKRIGLVFLLEAAWDRRVYTELVVHII